MCLNSFEEHKEFVSKFCFDNFYNSHHVIVHNSNVLNFVLGIGWHKMNFKTFFIIVNLITFVFIDIV